MMFYLVFLEWSHHERNGYAEPGYGIKSVKNRITKGFGVRAPGDVIGGHAGDQFFDCKPS